MPKPSDLIKKTNAHQYVIHAEGGVKMVKNPAYYMQPPSANSTIWSPARPAMETYRPMNPRRTPQQEAPQNPYPGSPQYQQPPQYPQQYAQQQQQQSAPQAQERRTPPTYPMPPRSVNPPADQRPTPSESAPVVGTDDMRIAVMPPNIPGPQITNNSSIYKDLMRKHDRARARNQEK